MPLDVTHKALTTRPRVEAFRQMGACVVLCRGAAAVYYGDRRKHQALHVGRRRRTVYLAEGIFEKIQVPVKQTTVMNNLCR